MAKRRVRIYEVLRPSHLQAIGRVAAEWSYLEFAVLDSIATVAGIELWKVVIIAAPSNLAAWNDMLMVFVKQSSAYAPIEKKLNKHCELLKDLQTERNAVVHAVWTPDTAGALAKAILAKQGPPKRVQGTGIPKRGRKVIVPFSKTPQEIRQTANKIAKARIRLGELINRQTKAWQRRLLSKGGLLAQNLRHTRAMPSTPPLTSGVSPTPLLSPQKP